MTSPTLTFTITLNETTTMKTRQHNAGAFNPNALSVALDFNEKKANLDGLKKVDVRVNITETHHCGKTTKRSNVDKIMAKALKPSRRGALIGKGKLVLNDSMVDIERVLVDIKMTVDGQEIKTIDIVLSIDLDPHNTVLERSNKHEMIMG